MTTSSSAATYLEKVAVSSNHDQGNQVFIAKLVINRPTAANSFNEEVMDGLIENLNKVKQDSSIRILILQSIGKHFSAGADLTWMQASAEMNPEQNKQEAERLTTLFETLYQMNIPTIAVAKGAAYGGAIGLLACCDYAVATENARFCLSEARIGLIPAVILPYLCRKMRPGDLKRLTLTGRVFTSTEALNAGLIQDISDSLAINQWLIKEVNQLLLASPNAQRHYKELHREVLDNGFKQGNYTSSAIAEIRATQEGKSGIKAFFEKQQPPWTGHVPEDTPLFEV